ncbi:MAG TPA: hypothetical protein VLR26_10125 [Frankiaceae bacterium]|nr:hypothetical protein [Frankiaceae bacterium]
MCLQSLSLWAEATRYRVQERRQAVRLKSETVETPVDLPPTRSAPQLVAVEPPAAEQEFVPAAHELVSAGGGSRWRQS